MITVAQPRRMPTTAWAVIVFTTGCVVGLPSLRGGFLSGDDYHLLLNHVLVNHPSISHALELFTIVHRDLYQPIPMLSFSIDFAIVNALGLNPTATGTSAGAWVFHLTNILIHALNATLVFFVLRRLVKFTARATASYGSSVPQGRGECSPALQCWDNAPLSIPSPEGTAEVERAAFQPSLRDSAPSAPAYPVLKHGATFTPTRGGQTAETPNTFTAAAGESTPRPHNATTPLIDSAILPAIAAVIFALHPLTAEPIAWLNGRMMLLSACFTLAALLAFDRWNDRPSASRAIATLLFTLLAHASKVSAALPILIAVFALYRRRKPTRRWWAMWGAVTVVTAVFAGFAAVSSQGMIDDARAEMSAPPAIYCLLALGQYFRQFLAPIGLSPWYPPPQQIGWTDPRVLTAAAVIAAVIITVIVSGRYTRVGILGMTWFLFAVAPTLPFVPARRSIGADRYVYLPNVGLAWIAATAIVALYVWFNRRAVSPRAGAPPRPGVGDRRMARASALLAGTIAVFALIFTNWSAQSHFATNIAQAHRIIQLNPDYPGVYESAAWAYFREARFEEAIDIAHEDLNRHPATMACEVYQVIGMAQLRLNRFEEAVETLKKAVAANPEYGKAYSRLAKAQEETGRIEEAIVNYERAAEIMPQYNPGLLELAAAYRSVGRTDDAVRLYQRVLNINAFDVTAQLALAEIDLDQQQFAAAAARLTQLLDWMPENAVARTNLGVAHEGLNRFDDAIVAYREALDRDEHAVVALVNLGNLYLRANRADHARSLFLHFVPSNPTDQRLLSAFHDFAVRINEPKLAADLLRRMSGMFLDDDWPRLYAAYACAQSGDTDHADQLLSYYRSFTGFPAPAARPEPCQFGGCALTELTQILISLYRGHPDDAARRAEFVLTLKSPFPPDARDRLVADMQRFAESHPSDPWPYYITALVLIAQHQPDFARLAIDEFLTRCPDDACRARADGLRSRIDAGSPDPARTE
ncbi:MAG: tetratricopeptide repeat protein [Phycisphaerales bacterium]|nr:tetratricopeptide repeat protein [Phycisphaerales bacterium]